MRLRDAIRDALIVGRWHRRGRPIPPPHQVKQRVVRSYASRFKVPNFVETGTYKGDMVDAMKRRFDQITSIEVDEALATSARSRFKDEMHISVEHGDSSVLLPDVITGMKGDCLFWLDGHYSGGETSQGTHQTPIVEELRHIRVRVSNAVILIDDARLFDGTNEYPTIGELLVLVGELWPDYQCEVKNDIIRIHPRTYERRRFRRDI